MEPAAFDRSVLMGVEQHHERLDGSGYPHGLTEVSFTGQTVGLVDSYDALTTFYQGQGKPMEPMETLTLLHKDVKESRFQMKLFKNFAYSLVK